ncbi:NAD-dependent succinate-semialdehyde dehydrogenase, partial [Cribrihabitans sp. XS_ASV171]
MADTKSYAQLELLIGGRWRQGSEGKTEPVVNPATGEELGQLPHAAAQDLDEAIAASQAGFEIWSLTPAHERQAVIDRAVVLLRERHARISRILTLENGKPLAEAELEITFVADTLKWYGEEARRAYGRIIPARAPNLRTHVLHEPVGPCVAFAAWNFPGTNVIRKIAGPVAAGCSLILKASEETPGTCIEIARCLQDAGLPGGVLNLVFGVPDTISRHLLASPVPRKVSLTGSTALGKHLSELAARTLKRCTMELGGHAPVVIAADCDLDAAIATMVKTKIRNAGQVCISPTRFLVEKAVYGDFLDGFSEAMAATRLGNGLEKDTDMGPLIAGRRVEFMNALIDDAASKGAKVTTGGNAGERSFFEPTVLADTTSQMRAMNEEPFGPLALVSPVEDLEAAVAEANRLPVGLAAYAFTRSHASSLYLQQKLNAGMIAINQPAVSLPEAPFGGVDESGYGSEGGSE